MIYSQIDVHREFNTPKNKRNKTEEKSFVMGETVTVKGCDTW